MARFSPGFLTSAALASLPWVIFLAGCAPQKINPSFTVTHAQARADIARMQHDPKPMDRPVVIIGGFLDPNFLGHAEACLIHSVSHDPKVLEVSLFTAGSFAECRRRIVEEVDKEFPPTDPNWTAPVDVIGNSLGGLAARYAAAPSEDPKQPRRLRMVRLFTISSPLRGAKLAQSIAFTQFHRDMAPGSGFLKSLERSDAIAMYSTTSYVHLGDNTVGAINASLPGEAPYWLSDAWWVPPHVGAMYDPRILADILRRLRDEPPLTAPNPATLPSE